MRSSTSEEISLLMWRVYSMVTYQVTAVDKSYQMRGIGNFYVADSKIAWQQVVDSMAPNVLAAEGSWLGRRIKAGLFGVLRRPIWRHLLPVGSAPILSDTYWDVVFMGNNEKWIAFDFERARVTRKLSSKALFHQELWVRRQPAVISISPAILEWDEPNLIFTEQYMHGRCIPLYDLDEGLAALRVLWPHLGLVFDTQVFDKPLELRFEGKCETLLNVLKEAGLDGMPSILNGQPIRQGLVHGDLKHPNVIRHDGSLYVIDWGEQCFQAPPLFDLLYYLFWHTRAFAPHVVVRQAFRDSAWIAEGWSTSLTPQTVDASLLIFAQHMIARLKHERSSRRHFRRLVSFLRAAGEELQRI